MAESFQPHPEAQDDDKDEDLQEEQVIQRKRLGRVMDRLLSRDESKESEEEDEETEKTKKKKRKMSKLLLSLLGLSAEENDNKEKSGNNSKAETSLVDLFVNKEQTPDDEKRDQIEPESIEGPEDLGITTRGETVELPAPDEPIVIETDEIIDIPDPVDNVSDAEVEHTMEVEDEEIKNQTDEELPPIETEEGVLFVDHSDEVLDRPVEREARTEESPINTNEVEHKETSGAALASAVAEEMIEKHRNKETREKLKEATKQQQETKKDFVTMEQKRQKLEQKIRGETEARERFEEKYKREKQKPVPEISVPKVEQNVPKFESQTPKSDIKEKAPEVARPLIEAQEHLEDLKRKLMALETAQELVEQVDTAVKQDARIERERARELSFERETGFNDSDQKSAYRSLVPDEAPAFSDISELSSERTYTKALERAKSNKHLRTSAKNQTFGAYKQAVSTGVAIALVIIAVIFVIFLLS